MIVDCAAAIAFLTVTYAFAALLHPSDALGATPDAAASASDTVLRWHRDLVPPDYSVSHPDEGIRGVVIFADHACNDAFSSDAA